MQATVTVQSSSVQLLSCPEDTVVLHHLRFSSIMVLAAGGTDVPFGDEFSVVTYSLHVDHLWLSGLASIHCKKRLLVSGGSSVLLNRLHSIPLCHDTSFQAPS